MHSKEKLLLLHGALGSKKQFEPLKEVLNENFEVYDLNFEGHGGSVTDNDFSIELFTHNALAFFQKEGIDELSIFGYSMGGYVALNLALHFPEKVKKILTLGTKFDWSEVTAAAEVRLLQPDVIEEKVPHFAQKLKEEHSPADWKQLMRKTAQMMLQMGAGKKLSEEAFSKIQHPVIIGIGNKDQMVTIEESKRTADLLPNGELLVLDDVPHSLEKVDEKLLLNYIFTALQNS